MPETVIEVNNLSKFYPLHHRRKGRPDNLKWALKDINFTLSCGEVLGIVGMNGAGKSTLLKLLTQVTRPSGGKIIISGKVLSILEVGIGFIPELTGRENIMLYAELYNLSKKDILPRINDIIEFSGIKEYIDQPVKFYSSGMYLRLAFSTIIAFDADIYIFDEVLSVGDLQFRSKVLNYFKTLKEKGKTIIIVSHSPAEIAELCDKMMLIHQGNLVTLGNPLETIKMLTELARSMSVNNPLNTEQEISTLAESEFCKINTVQIFSDKNCSGIFNRNNPIIIAVDYTLKRDIPVDFTVNINNSHSVPVISTSTLFKKELVPEKEGNYSLQFRLPAGFLNSGNYRIELYAVDRLQMNAIGIANRFSFQVLPSDDEEKSSFFPSSVYLDLFDSAKEK
jgi:lipopolysaccharide transport system ATP-binding protein